MSRPTCPDVERVTAHAQHQRAHGLGAGLAGDAALDRLLQLAIALESEEAPHFRDRGNIFRKMLFHLRGEVGGDPLVPAGRRQFQDVFELQRQRPSRKTNQWNACIEQPEIATHRRVRQSHVDPLRGFTHPMPRTQARCFS
jgi:hypothetical protein